MLVPALYALIVLSSIWDPTARTSQLPVALVNQDVGLGFGQRDVNLGAEVLQTLRGQGLFAYRVFSDAEEARRQVRDGRLAFAVLLPADFSRQAVLGVEPGGGRLILYLSEGNNYAAAGLARRFAPELAHRVNETLNERRWALVLDAGAGAQRDLASLRLAITRLSEGATRTSLGLHQARLGAGQLAAGLGSARDAGQQLQLATARLAEGAGQLGSGLHQLGDGLRSIDGQAAPARDLLALRQGGLALQRGHAELGAGLQQVQAGSGQLVNGIARFKAEAGQQFFGGVRISLAAGTLQAGAEKLDSGLQAARDAQGRLADGALRFVEGSGRLAEGLQRQSAAIGQLASHWPADAQTAGLTTGTAAAASGAASLADGLRQLHQGQARLQQGLVHIDQGGTELAARLRQLQAALPPADSNQGGTPAGLAHSVRPVLEVVAPVASDGAGYSPNFVPLALWMGAVMTAFLFNFTRLPAPLAGAPGLAKVAGRLAFPALVAAGQSLLMLAMLAGGLGLAAQRLLPVAATLLAASMVFLCLIFALVHLFGDIGKMVAVLLLVVQMSAAGALLPIELTAPVFQALHQWLPLTWVVRALRASLFGAYDGDWASAWAAMLATAAGALALAVIFGRWRLVPAEAYRPALEVD